MPSTTTFMSLTTWPDGTDLFDHATLASNFGAIDNHDHTPGNGTPVPTAGIADGAVTAPKIASDAVTTVKLSPGCVTTEKHAATPYVLLSDPTPTGLITAEAQLLSWGSEVLSLDNAAMHSAVTNPERITIPVAGVYQVWVNLQAADETVGIRTLVLVHSPGGAGLYYLRSTSPGSGVASYTVALPADSYVVVWAQAVTTACSVSLGYFSATWVAAYPV